MKLQLALLAALLAAAAPALHAQTPDKDRAATCVTCHGEQARQSRTGIHAQAGVDCITCHGGVAGEIEVERAHAGGLRKLDDARASVELCGACHTDVDKMRNYGLRTDQLSLYWTSRHGAKLATDGDANVATCVSCHGSHGVVHSSDPLSPVHARNQPVTCGGCHSDSAKMGAYGLAANQVEKFRGSVHGHALLDDEHPAAPSCSDCHGSHGALPPRVGDVEMVCGHCHSVVQHYYDESPHATSGGAVQAVQCTACHDNHGVERPSADMFLGDDVGHCGNCHSDEQDPAIAVAKALHADVEKLVATIRDADLEIERAAERGLFLGEERGYLEEARGLLVRARTMTHTLAPAALDDVLNRGQAMVETTMESLATKSRTFRDRKIFTALFFAVSAAFAIALSMHGRELVGRWKRARRGA